MLESYGVSDDIGTILECCKNTTYEMLIKIVTQDENDEVY